MGGQMEGRPLRSWMFVPGNRQRFIDKARTMEGGPDAIFLDLEDGVVPPEKPVAREMVRDALQRPAGGPVRFVRVNSVGTEWFWEDLRWILVPGLEGLCLPKVESPDEVKVVAAVLDRWEREAGLVPGSVHIVAAIESAKGLLRSPDIAACHSRVLGLMLGAEDYALDIGLGTKREAEAQQLQFARSYIVVAAAAAGVLAIDGVFPNLEDPEGLLADCLLARRLGFDAKSTFNPRQIEVINRVFSPSQDEVEYARRVVKAFEEAAARGEGSVAVGGQLVDLPIVRRAQRVLSLVERYNLHISSQGEG